MLNMPYRASTFAEGEYYHIYNRGVGKGPIFFNPGNYQFCINLIYRYSEKYRLGLVAYCLMPNHYHFLLGQVEEVPVSRFINNLFSSYVQAVNRQQGRVGTLFESRFKHAALGTDELILYLCRYIHLNPAKAGLVEQPEDWPYSDYRQWLRNENPAAKTFLENYFTGSHGYRRFVHDCKDELEALRKITAVVWDD